ncbi:MAG: hypothetical protein WA421_17385 [Nitrososphaeraceae archaeon]
MSNNKGTVDNNETKKIHIDTFCQSLDEFGTTFRDRCLRMVKG